MIPEGNLKSNVDRFSGYQDYYDQYRPEAPGQAVEIVTAYAGGKPRLVADVGCGTGLSSFVWLGKAEQIVGIEPNDDMRGKAEQKAAAVGSGAISFIPGYSNQLSLAAGSVDVVTCSQSFHWMEPESTLKEFARVLRDGGVFAAYDCDWPPTLMWTLEDSYNRLLAKSDMLLAQLVPKDDQAVKRDKNKHLQHIRQSGHFRFAKEIVFHNMESCDADRYVGLAISQGGLQTVLKLGSTALDDDIAEFRRQVEDYFQGRTLEVMFNYRMRVGVK
ncbi:class I SAM-dependent methyltransferase [Paenibacillus doosanensis]|uniref:class I SAM-dependent methyltransferase n=1 Tax=Paenibacillus doosanensis TaxID=1229154 RepID=UPI00217FCA7C|nr:class I SAM-dependent methyltransferase [Paenibacillus doosanensis]MCS7459651.1 class I SAM-dependent methyltransferase [Paenibacillus doosanensis]